MGVLNFFKRKQDSDLEKKGVDWSKALEKVDTSNLTTMQKMAFGFFKKLPKSKQEEVLRKALNPQNIFKEKEKIIKQLNEAVRAGQMTKAEAQQIKNQLGLR